MSTVPIVCGAFVSICLWATKRYGIFLYTLPCYLLMVLSAISATDGAAADRATWLCKSWITCAHLWTLALSLLSMQCLYMLLWGFRFETIEARSRFVMMTVLMLLQAAVRTTAGPHTRAGLGLAFGTFLLCVALVIGIYLARDAYAAHKRQRFDLDWTRRALAVAGAYLLVLLATTQILSVEYQAFCQLEQPADAPYATPGDIGVISLSLALILLSSQLRNLRLREYRPTVFLPTTSLEQVIDRSGSKLRRTVMHALAQRVSPGQDLPTQSGTSLQLSAALSSAALHFRRRSTLDLALDGRDRYHSTSDLSIAFDSPSLPTVARWWTPAPLSAASAGKTPAPMPLLDMQKTAPVSVDDRLGVLGSMYMAQRQHQPEFRPDALCDDGLASAGAAEEDGHFAASGAESSDAKSTFWRLTSGSGPTVPETRSTSAERQRSVRDFAKELTSAQPVASQLRLLLEQQITLYLGRAVTHASLSPLFFEPLARLRVAHVAVTPAELLLALAFIQGGPLDFRFTGQVGRIATTGLTAQDQYNALARALVAVAMTILPSSTEAATDSQMRQRVLGNVQSLITCLSAADQRALVWASQDLQQHLVAQIYARSMAQADLPVDLRNVYQMALLYARVTRDVLVEDGDLHEHFWARVHSQLCILVWDCVADWTGMSVVRRAQLAFMDDQSTTDGTHLLSTESVVWNWPLQQQQDLVLYTHRSPPQSSPSSAPAPPPPVATTSYTAESKHASYAAGAAFSPFAQQQPIYRDGGPVPRVHWQERTWAATAGDKGETQPPLFHASWPAMPAGDPLGFRDRTFETLAGLSAAERQVGVVLFASLHDCRSLAQLMNALDQAWTQLKAKRRGLLLLAQLALLNHAGIRPLLDLLVLVPRASLASQETRTPLLLLLRWILAAQPYDAIGACMHPLYPLSREHSRPQETAACTQEHLRWATHMLAIIYFWSACDTRPLGQALGLPPSRDLSGSMTTVMTRVNWHMHHDTEYDLYAGWRAVCAARAFTAERLHRSVYPPSTDQKQDLRAGRHHPRHCHLPVEMFRELLVSPGASGLGEFRVSSTYAERLLQQPQPWIDLHISLWSGSVRHDRRLYKTVRHAVYLELQSLGTNRLGIEARQLQDLFWPCLDLAVAYCGQFPLHLLSLPGKQHRDAWVYQLCDHLGSVVGDVTSVEELADMCSILVVLVQAFFLELQTGRRMHATLGSILAESQSQDRPQQQQDISAKLGQWMMDYHCRRDEDQKQQSGRVVQKKVKLTKQTKATQILAAMDRHAAQNLAEHTHQLIQPAYGGAPANDLCTYLTPVFCLNPWKAICPMEIVIAERRPGEDLDDPLEAAARETSAAEWSDSNLDAIAQAAAGRAFK